MSLSQSFDELVNTYEQILQACSDALAPGVTQEQRNKVRDAIAQYLKDKPE